MATAVDTQFTCMLANLYGKGTPPPERARGRHERGKVQQIRYDNIKGYIDQDVLLLQELDEILMTKLRDKLQNGGTHDYFGSQKDVGVFLKKSKFRSEKSIDVTHMCNDKGIWGDNYERICLVQATLKDTNTSVLFVSYHGPYKINNIARRTKYTNLLQTCCRIRDNVGAKFVIIGGDFNHSHSDFRQHVLNGNEEFTLYHGTQRPNAKIIDYFLVQRGIQTQEPLVEKVVDCDDYYLHHWPLIATFSVVEQAQNTCK